MRFSFREQTGVSLRCLWMGFITDRRKSEWKILSSGNENYIRFRAKLGICFSKKQKKFRW